MEPWKLAVIAALIAGIFGFGYIAQTPKELGGVTSGPTGVQPTATPGPPKPFAKYMGTTLPAYSNIKQWANSSAPVNLASLKGKPVLLEVFRIECSHCNEAAPFLVGLHSRYAPRGVAFVGIQSPGDLTNPANPESNWAGVQQWLKSRGYTWPVGFDANSAWFQGKFGKDISYPTLFLFDKNGNAVFIQSGHDNGKAIQLAAELEHIAPGPGDLAAQTKDLSKFLASGLGITSDETAQSSLSKVVGERLSAIK